jgi:hypothetical protein
VDVSVLIIEGSSWGAVQVSTYGHLAVGGDRRSERTEDASRGRRDRDDQA